MKVKIQIDLLLSYPDSYLEDFAHLEDGTPVPPTEMRKWLEKLKRQGHTFVPMSEKEANDLPN